MTGQPGFAPHFDIVQILKRFGKGGVGLEKAEREDGENGARGEGKWKILNWVIKFLSHAWFHLARASCRSRLELGLRGHVFKLNLGHGCIGAAEVSSFGAWVLGVVIGDCGFDGVLGQHGAVH
jgi:hypothetical protein